MDAIRYLRKKARMLKSLGGENGGCKRVDCRDCPLSLFNNAKEISCSNFEGQYPEEAVAIVEKWSQEHPQKTILMDFIEKYPDAMLYVVNETPTFCPHWLGYEYECGGNCIDCWNRPL